MVFMQLGNINSTRFIDQREIGEGDNCLFIEFDSGRAGCCSAAGIQSLFRLLPEHTPRGSR